MIDLKKKYSCLPTVMEPDDQIEVMKDLIDIGHPTLLQDIGGLEIVLDNLEISHQYNHYLLDKSDEEFIVSFIILLNEIKNEVQIKNINIEGIIDTFQSLRVDTPYFDSNDV